MIDWDHIDTVLLDMDGTLLDLHYDNTLWNELLPARYGAAHDLSEDAARTHLFSHMHQHYGTLTFYCLDHWAEFTGLDIVALHEELVELVRYRPSAEHFLDWIRARGKRALLVTNAHRDSLRVKNARAAVVDRLGELMELGFGQLVLFTHDRCSEQTLELLSAEVIPQLPRV